MSEWQPILDFWLDDIGPDGWYVASDQVDGAIRERFGTASARAVDGDFEDWTSTPEGTLALLILLDQFPRNLHRGSGEAFAGDPRARDVARAAVARGDDLRIAEPGRQFFYLPFEHSEHLADQDWSVALFEVRMREDGGTTLRHARAHRDAIRRFGRFPFRNAALGRQSTPEEQRYLDEGGYRVDETD